MNSYDWILFDSTGTLMTPDPEPASVYHNLAATMGSQKTIDNVRSDLRAAMSVHFFSDSINQPTDETVEWKRWRSIVADTLPEIDERNFNSAFESLWQHFARPDAWRLYRDVIPTLNRLREKGYAIAIASNFDARLHPILVGLQIDHLIDEVLISSELGYSKPSTLFYTIAADRLWNIDQSRMLMIGDTKQGDVDAAIQSGLDARLLVRDQDDALLELTRDL